MANIVTYEPACLAAELWAVWPRWCPADIRDIVMLYVDPRAAWGLEFDVLPMTGTIAAAQRLTTRGLFSWMPGQLTLRHGETVTQIPVSFDYCSEIIEVPSGHIALFDLSKQLCVIGPDLEPVDAKIVWECAVPAWWPRPRRVINHYGRIIHARVAYRSAWHVYYFAYGCSIIVMHSRRSIYRRDGMCNPRIAYANAKYIYIISSGVLQICCARTLVTIAQYPCSREVAGTGNLYLEKTTGSEAALLVPRH